MIEIKLLTFFTMEDEKSLGLNGFDTDSVYEVVKDESGDDITISLKLKKLKKSIRKEWPHLESDIAMFEDIIKQGYSYAAYENGRLVGVVIAEKKHNSMWITEIVVADFCRNKGIGSLLLGKLTEVVERESINCIELETQSINYPAVSFYRKKGFELHGFNMPVQSDIDNETILYMRKMI